MGEARYKIRDLFEVNRENLCIAMIEDKNILEAGIEGCAGGEVGDGRDS